MSGRVRIILACIGVFLVSAVMVYVPTDYLLKGSLDASRCPVVGYVRIWPGEIEITTLRDITIDSKNNLHGMRLDPTTGDALGLVIHR